jgi:hypothetical protein
LGVVLFLASAKLLNRKSRFLVLDDIVTSFDLNVSLRRRPPVVRAWPADNVPANSQINGHA